MCSTMAQSTFFKAELVPREVLASTMVPMSTMMGIHDVGTVAIKLHKGSCFFHPILRQHQWSL